MNKRKNPLVFVFVVNLNANVRDALRTSRNGSNRQQTRTGAKQMKKKNMMESEQSTPACPMGTGIAENEGKERERAQPQCGERKHVKCIDYKPTLRPVCANETRKRARDSRIVLRHPAERLFLRILQPSDRISASADSITSRAVGPGRLSRM